MEAELRKAFDKEHLFESLIAKLNVSNAEEKDRIREALTEALPDGNDTKFKDSLAKVAGHTAAKAAEIIISKLFFA